MKASKYKLHGKKQTKKMPKRSKKKDKSDEYEGMPPDLTLGIFLNLPESASNVPSSSMSTSVREPDEENVCQGTLEHIEIDANVSEQSPEYFISKTKKGKLPITCENRSKGKKVTVISNITGNAGSLLHELKKRAGCGGVLREGTVELQGDRVHFVSTFLQGHSCLRPYKP